MTRRYVPTGLILACLMLAACQTTEMSSSAPEPAAGSAAKVSTGAASSGATRIEFALKDADTLGALQLEIQYKSASGRLAGDGDTVSCRATKEKVLSSFNHVVADKILRAAFVSLEGIPGDGVFAACDFEGGASPGDFRVTVEDVSAPDLGEVDSPNVVITVAGA